jgi:hypothetical protein
MLQILLEICESSARTSRFTPGAILWTNVDGNF